MPQVHPTAVVAAGAKIADDVEIGPYCVIGGDVALDSGVRLQSHVVIDGRTRIGAGTQIYPFASIGQQPQDKKYAGEKSELLIGRNNVIREYVTMHPGTAGGSMVTKIGDSCLFMACAHVAHDCIIGNEVIMVNNTLLGGHVELGDFAIVGGGAAIHQFVRIGRHAMIGGLSGVEHDVIPFGSVTGNRAHLSGLNLVGMRRRGFEREDIHKLRNAYRLLFAQEGTLQERLEDVAQLFTGTAVVQDVVEFIRNASARGICQPHPDADAS